MTNTEITEQANALEEELTSMTAQIAVQSTDVGAEEIEENVYLVARSVGTSSEMLTEAVSLVERMQSVFAEGWYTLGTWIMENTASGMRSASQSVIAAALAVSEEALDRAQTFYTSSPLTEKMYEEASAVLSRGMAESVLREENDVREAVGTTVNRYIPAQREADDNRGGRNVIQYITLRENDQTPYQTARAIRRESEALLRV